MDKRILLARHITDLLREFNKRGQFVKKAYGTQVSLAEAYILVELDLDPSLNAKDLSLLLNLNSSTISRSLKSLIDRNYLERCPDPRDRRQKLLSLKTKAKRFVEIHYQANQQQMAEFTKNLSTDEEIDLFGYLKTLADNDGALPISVPPREHPIMIQMRRFARHWAVMGPSFVDTKYSGFHWQALAAIKENEGRVRGKDLAELFTLPKNTLSQMMARLEKEDLIYKKPFKHDRRNWGISLTKRGLKAHNEIRNRLASRIDLALSELTDHQLKRFVRLMETSVGWNQGSVNLIIREQLRAEQLKEKQLQTARAFLILELVRSNRLHQAGECLIGKDNLVFGLFQEDKLSGVTEYKIEQDRLILINFAVSLAIEDGKASQEFLSRTASTALQMEKKVELLIIQESGAAEYFVDRGLGKAAGEDLLLREEDLKD